MSKTFIIMCGVAGSGKSTLIKNLFQFYTTQGKGWQKDTAIFNPDSNVPRCEQSDKRVYNSITLREAWGKAWQGVARSFLENTKTMIFDATFTTSISRSPAINLAKGTGYHVVVIHFCIPIEVCKERNQDRFDCIPEEGIDRQFEQFQSPELEEGIDTIYRINEQGQLLSIEGEKHPLDQFFPAIIDSRKNS
jgi:predicted kinase